METIKFLHKNTSMGGTQAWYCAELVKDGFIANGFTVSYDNYPTYATSGTRVVIFEKEELFYPVAVNAVLGTGASRSVSIASCYKQSGIAHISYIINVYVKSSTTSTSGQFTFSLAYNNDIMLMFSDGYGSSIKDFDTYDPSTVSVLAVVKPKRISTGEYIGGVVLKYGWFGSPMTTYDFDTLEAKDFGAVTSFQLPSIDFIETEHAGNILAMPCMSSEIGEPNTIAALTVEGMIMTSGFPSDCPSMFYLDDELYFRLNNVAVKW